MPRLLPPALLAATLAAGLLGSSIGHARPDNFPPGVVAPDVRFGIADGFRNASTMEAIGAGWERVVLSWSQIQPYGPDDFSWLGNTLPTQPLQADVDRGVRVAGLLQFTPDWARADPDAGERSVPLNLDLPYNHPENYWGQFVYRTVWYYQGRIDEWILWNEPEFQPGDAGAGESYTWLGTDEQFARLMQVGYQAAKAANPHAVVSFPGTSYWVEELSSPKRTPFYERYLALIAQDPDADANHWYHDAVALNLYRAPDDLPRVHAIFKAMQARYGQDKPLWLQELNAMPTDDDGIDCADRFAAGGFQTTMDEQAAYAVQALALAAAAGYERIGFYKMEDGDTCLEPAVWGITRTDGSQRPVASTLRTAVGFFSGYTRAQFVPSERPTRRWAAWPSDPSSYTPNWQIYQVALDLPDARRVTVLWNGDGVPRRARIPVAGDGTATLVDMWGAEQPLTSLGGSWLVDLPAATAHFYVNETLKDPDGYYFIGGAPLILVEERVAPDAPVVVPRLA